MKRTLQCYQNLLSTLLQEKKGLKIKKKFNCCRRWKSVFWWNATVLWQLHYKFVLYNELACHKQTFLICPEDGKIPESAIYIVFDNYNCEDDKFLNPSKGRLTSSTKSNICSLNQVSNPSEWMEFLSNNKKKFQLCNMLAAFLPVNT